MINKLLMWLGDWFITIGSNLLNRCELPQYDSEATIQSIMEQIKQDDSNVYVCEDWE